MCNTIRRLACAVIIMGLLHACPCAWAGSDADRNLQGWAAMNGHITWHSEWNDAVLKWQFTYNRDAAVLMRSADEAWREMKTISFKIKSDRRGPLFFRLDQTDKTSYVALFDVSTDWQRVTLSANEFVPHGGSGRPLNRRAIDKAFLVDLSGSDGEARGRRTIWLKRLTLDGSEVIAGLIEGAVVGLLSKLAGDEATQEWQAPAVPAGSLEGGSAAPPAGSFAAPSVTRRPFHMGMYLWPHAFTPEAGEEAYRLVTTYGDLSAPHTGDDVPWAEALANAPYHPKVMQYIQDRVNRLAPHQETYISANFLNQDRDDLADYWGQERNMPRSGAWKHKAFDDPDVMTAYTNYCLYLIKRYRPDYMAYGIEVNNKITVKHPDFPQLLTLVKHVYTALKQAHPSLPVFLTLHTGSFFKDQAIQRETCQRLLQFSDYVAITTYPYWVPGMKIPSNANPADLPRNWFAQMAELAPEKPFAISESGYIAEDLVLEKYNVRMKGTEAWQARFMELMLEEATRLQAKFVLYFVPRDYDEGWEHLKRLGTDEYFKTWRDTGLIDGRGTHRLAFQVWKAWLGLPKE